MKITLSLMPNRYSSVNFRLSRPNYAFIGKVVYQWQDGALVFNHETSVYEMARRGFPAVPLPTGEVLYHINIENAKRGANQVTHYGTPAPYEPFTPPPSHVIGKSDPKPVGRSAYYGKAMRQTGISLSDEMIDACRKLGNGSVAEGVRYCITICTMPTNGIK
jgi:hypothetical protein